MRELYEYGRLTSRTEVCAEGESEWNTLSSYPEITGHRGEMETVLADGKDTARIAYERRMWCWLAGLLSLYGVYAWFTWK
jgi:hypothetical protein